MITFDKNKIMIRLSEKFDVLNKRRSHQALWHAHKTSPNGVSLLKTNNIF
jgi:hypothetical protein